MFFVLVDRRSLTNDDISDCRYKACLVSTIAGFPTPCHPRIMNSRWSLKTRVTLGLCPMAMAYKKAYFSNFINKKTKI